MLPTPTTSAPISTAATATVTSAVRRVLLINPNTNAATTARLSNVLTPHLPTDCEFIIKTARFGATYIACEASHAIAAHACLDAWADWRSQNTGSLDGVLIGCFGDPGLFALREASSCKVTGLAEASFLLAAQHGPFAIVTGGERWKPMLERLANSLGFGEQLRHIETVIPSGAELQANPEMAIQCLTDACLQAARGDVRSIILGGAGLAGYAQTLQARVELPLIDSALAGLKIMLSGMAPPPVRQEDGFYATWNNLPKSLSKLGRQ
ncbi:MAG: aspartate/glutamate racemase family protein [Cytophagales bacterium]|nr:aspartate/glutamate racemase family protein [Cytophagales bacterium]